MATVTGLQPGEEDEARFSRRGPGAGRFNPSGVMPQRQGDGGGMFQGLLNFLDLGRPKGVQITGSTGQEGPAVTEGGVGIRRGQAPVTSGAGTRLSRAGNQLAGGVTQLGQNAAALPLGRIGTFGTAGLMGAQQLAQGNVPGAVAETGGALAGGAIASAVAKAIPGPWGMAARVALPVLGSLAGGQIAGGLTGAVAAKAQEPGAEPIYIPGTNIPLNQSAQYENLRNRDLAYQLRASKSTSDQALAQNRQLLTDTRNDEILRQKAMLPLQEQINRSNLINAQSMLASQTAAYQQLGQTAGMFQLAKGAQSETGATLRTAISNNPYIGATLSAPSISFG